MADPQEQSSESTGFPNPPAFWRDFTPDRLARFQELKQTYLDQHHSDDGDSNDAGRPETVRIPDLPEDLALLQPPPEPIDGTWRVFNMDYSLDSKLPTLEELGMVDLPATHPSRATATTGTNPSEAAAIDARDGTHYDHALELKRLTKSLLVNFLELAGTLSRNPGHAWEKVTDLRTLLINIHHALNEYRPHQARESAAELMQEHLDRTRRETIAVRSQVDKARRVLEGLGSLTVPEEKGAEVKTETKVETNGMTRDSGVSEKVVDDKRDDELWAEVDAMFA